ncbi:hypothetical protein CAPTEDRAFT_206958 [Capitella teleta]|uniref:Uncharacterized protein n=1 Tax=Capitella teleta TaxID=283909 RepID=R7URW3_CAPTE|nr:hypothetical protein CAPTEDRAFT_206958 [Capitella teleta]|eukprot:ELU08888.1 hypothetical protein CAPTEDRAFT_206958 [Capitella teleta]
MTGNAANRWRLGHPNSLMQTTTLHRLLAFCQTLIIAAVPVEPEVPDMILRLNVQNTTAMFVAYKFEPGDVSSNVTVATLRPYDAKGAMYFAVAVILLYGVSIALMIGSTLRKQEFEYEVKGFLRSYARIDQQKRKREKQRMRNTLIEKNLISLIPECTMAVAAPSLYVKSPDVTSPKPELSMASIKEEEESPITTDNN